MTYVQQAMNQSVQSINQSINQPI